MQRRGEHEDLRFLPARHATVADRRNFRRSHSYFTTMSNREPIKPAAHRNPTPYPSVSTPHCIVERRQPPCVVKMPKSMKRAPSGLRMASGTLGDKRVSTAQMRFLSQQRTEYESSMLSRLLFMWVTPLVRHGVRVRGALEARHLWPVREADSATGMYRKFVRLLKPDTAATIAPAPLEQTATGNTQPDPITASGIAWLLLRLARGRMALSALAMALFVGVTLVSPLLLRGLVRSVDNSLSEDDVGVALASSTGYDGLYYAAALCCAQFIGSLASAHQLHHSFLTGQRSRTLVMGMVYRKALGMTEAARQGVSAGSVVNLVANDAQKVFELWPQLHLLWALPLLIGGATAFVVDILGAGPAFAGICTLACLIPLNLLVGVATSKLRKKHMAATDERVHLCQEVLEGMRVVKLFNYTSRQEQRILKLREVEVQCARREALFYSLSTSLLITIPVVAVVTAFVVYTVTSDEPLSAGSAFAALGFFNVLRFPLMNLSNVINAVVQCLTALRRLATFLSAPSTTSNGDAAATTSAQPSAAGGDTPAGWRASPVVRVKNASFSWAGDAEAGKDEGLAATLPRARGVKQTGEDDGSDSRPFVLRDVDFEAYDGDLVVVVGAVGAGKSTLVSGLLSEARVLQGEVTVRTSSGQVGLATQQAWIQNATIRDNICFGHEFDRVRYTRVLSACALEADMKQLPAGDFTEVCVCGSVCVWLCVCVCLWLCVVFGVSL